MIIVSRRSVNETSLYYKCHVVVSRYTFRVWGEALRRHGPHWLQKGGLCLSRSSHWLAVRLCRKLATNEQSIFRTTFKYLHVRVQVESISSNQTHETKNHISSDFQRTSDVCTMQLIKRLSTLPDLFSPNNQLQTKGESYSILTSPVGM